MTGPDLESYADLPADTADPALESVADGPDASLALESYAATPQTPEETTPRATEVLVEFLRREAD